MVLLDFSRMYRAKIRSFDLRMFKTVELSLDILL